MCAALKRARLTATLTRCLAQRTRTQHKQPSSRRELGPHLGLRNEPDDGQQTAPSTLAVGSTSAGAGAGAGAADLATAATSRFDGRLLLLPEPARGEARRAVRPGDAGAREPRQPGQERHQRPGRCVKLLRDAASSTTPLLLRSSSSAARCWLAGRRSAPASTVAGAGIGSPTSPGIPEEISCGEFSVAEVRATTRSAPPPAARLLLAGAGASQLCRTGRRCSATQSSGS